MPQRLPLLLCLLTGSWVSCKMDEEPERGAVTQPASGAQAGVAWDAEVWLPLVKGSGWEPLEPRQDPFWERAEGRQPCGQNDFGEEYGGLEVSTSYCGYLTLSQPLLRALQPGDLLELSAWHGPLVSAAPAEGLMSLSVAGQALWSEVLLIPAAARSWVVRFESKVEAPAGEPLIFHISNHGSNSYTLYALKVAAP